MAICGELRHLRLFLLSRESDVRVVSLSAGAERARGARPVVGCLDAVSSKLIVVVLVAMLSTS